MRLHRPLSAPRIFLAAGLLMVFAHVLCAEHFNAQVHDPVMIKQDSTYYVFYTGAGVPVWSSKDMKTWVQGKPVFEKAPDWTLQRYPKFRNVEFAPDITLHNGTYYLYYAVASTANNSSIGVATNRTLHQDSPDYKWVDHGPVVESVVGRDLFNAIDPNLAFDEQGTPYLTFGSFWMGMKQVKLNPNLTEVAKPEQWSTVAGRERYSKIEEDDAGDAMSGAIEAPFIFKKNGLYYLFVSWDYCCRGVNSTYKVVVGRSEKITGPYLDKEGQQMRLGGGSLVVAGNKDWPGVGHNSAYTFDGKDYLVFHGYDAADQGRSKLFIEEIQWDTNGWPWVSIK